MIVTKINSIEVAVSHLILQINCSNAVNNIINHVNKEIPEKVSPHITVIAHNDKTLLICIRDGTCLPFASYKCSYLSTHWH